jgi:tryptophan synthase alpha chain
MTSATVGSQRIGRAFAAAKEAGRICFAPYVVAGYPDMAASEQLALAALDSGADLMEIGLPYSDPLADGVTLQRASTAALAQGATLDAALDMVERVAQARPDKPVLVMGYANQFMGPRGERAIATRLTAAGAAGAIVADLPPDEGAPLEEAFVENGLALVYLVAPTSSAERLTLIGERSGGFVYCVSLAGVTGARRRGPAKLGALVARVKERSPLPVAVGFGVSRPEHVRAVAATGADGVAVGSALIDSLGPDGRDEASFRDLCGALARATTTRPLAA